MKNYIIHFSLLAILLPHIVVAQHQRTKHWTTKTTLFKNEATMDEKNKVVFYGNSLTEGFDLECYFPKSLPINRGISGDHIDGLIERFDYSVKILNPSKLFVMIGINDLGAGDPDSLIISNYKQLMQYISRDLPQTEIYIQSILPTSAVWTNCPKETIKIINRDIYAFAKNLGFNWIDLYSQFKTDEDYLNPKYSTDGLHLNPKGYKLWCEILKKYGME